MMCSRNKSSGTVTSGAFVSFEFFFFCSEVVGGKNMKISLINSRKVELSSQATFHLISRADFEYEFLDTIRARAFPGAWDQRRAREKPISHLPRLLDSLMKFQHRRSFPLEFPSSKRQTPASGTFKGVRSYLFFNPNRKRFPRAVKGRTFLIKSTFAACRRLGQASPWLPSELFDCLNIQSS